MVQLGQIYRVGNWTAKPGKETEFVDAWHKSSTWTAENLPGGGEALLLQDGENTRQFVSFALSTRPQDFESLGSRPEFQDFMADIRELCDDIQPHTMLVAAQSARQSEEKDE